MTTVLPVRPDATGAEVGNDMAPVRGIETSVEGLQRHNKNGPRSRILHTEEPSPKAGARPGIWPTHTTDSIGSARRSSTS